MINDRQLIIEPQEAELVKKIFNLYLVCKSPLKMMQTLQQEGHTNKRWQTAAGLWRGGNKINVSHVNKILRNVIYVGKVQHGKETYPGQHRPIIDEALWNEVQDSICSQQKNNRHHWHSHFLLKGKLKTYEGYCMSPSTTNLNKKQDNQQHKQKKRYYVSRKALTEGYKQCAIKTLSADLLEALVINHVMHYLFQTCINIFYIISQLTHDTERSQQLRQLIEGVTVRPDRLDIAISKAGLSQLALQESLHTTQKIDNPPMIIHQPDIIDGAGTITLQLPIQIKRTNGRRLIVSQDGKDLVLPAQLKPDPVLVQAIGRSFGWKKLLEKSPELTIRDLAKQCGYSDRYLSRQLPLTGLAPDILHRALSGTLPSTVTLHGLEEASAYLSWPQQRTHLGLN